MKKSLVENAAITEHFQFRKAIDVETWTKILDALKGSANTIYIERNKIEIGNIHSGIGHINTSESVQELIYELELLKYRLNEQAHDMEILHYKNKALLDENKLLKEMVDVLKSK